LARKIPVYPADANPDSDRPQFYCTTARKTSLIRRLRAKELPDGSLQLLRAADPKMIKTGLIDGCKSGEWRPRHSGPVVTMQFQPVR
jgi:hypothetical protein